MSEPFQPPLSETTAELLDSVFFAPLRAALARIRTRSCGVLEDQDLVLLAVGRVLQENASGRDFPQTHGLPAVPLLKCHGYFKNLRSKRRLRILQEADRFMRETFLPLLRAGDDRLRALPGLDGWEVWAGDGHAMQHATHDTRNGEGSHRSVKAIYRIDLRTGWAGFLDLQQPTAKDSEHEITTLKRLDKETLRCGAPKGARVLWVYDSAAVDFRFGYNLKYMKSTSESLSPPGTSNGRAAEGNCVAARRPACRRQGWGAAGGGPAGRRAGPGLRSRLAVLLFAGGGDHRHGTAVLVTAQGDDHAAFAVADAFAVDGEAAGEDAGIGLEPGGQRAGVGFRVDGVHEVVEGVVAGHFEPPAAFVAHLQTDGGALALWNNPESPRLAKAAEFDASEERGKPRWRRWKSAEGTGWHGRSQIRR